MTSGRRTERETSGERHQQQMKVIQDKFIYKQELLEKHKAKEEKENRDAEVRRVEDEHHCDREQASKNIQAIPKMTASETIYNCIVRIERIFTTKNICGLELYAKYLQAMC